MLMRHSDFYYRNFLWSVTGHMHTSSCKDRQWQIGNRQGPWESGKRQSIRDVRNWKVSFPQTKKKSKNGKYISEYLSVIRLKRNKFWRTKMRLLFLVVLLWSFWKLWLSWWSSWRLCGCTWSSLITLVHFLSVEMVKYQISANLKNAFQTDGPTDGRTDGPMCRVACPRLKISSAIYQSLQA